MTIEEVKKEFGSDADIMCSRFCDLCTSNDWYCISDCKKIAWIRKHYDKAVVRLAKLDGDYVEFFERVGKWK